jgi:hypothetical protein
VYAAGMYDDPLEYLAVTAAADDSAAGTSKAVKNEAMLLDMMGD